MTKAAILIDGGFFLKRLPTVRPDIDATDAISIDKSIGQLVYSHLEHLQKLHGGETAYALLYRCFLYDAMPYVRRAHQPVSKKAIDYSKTDEAQLRLKLFDCLRRRANFAVRLGTVERERAWILREKSQNQLLKREKKFDQLTDDDFYPGFRQKAVDMRLGLDIASLTLKRQVDTIILVTGDSDFVPAAKLARREGVKVVLDPLWQSVKPGLFEHIDGLRSGFGKPGKKQTVQSDIDEANNI
ncbi:MAG: NYN domain-containing protein [Ahrensia sp.]|nr:NYN domain-containing protein [Ahrensia sp.]